MKLPSVRDLPVANKRVLLRTNYDVPLKKFPIKEISDTSRIEESLPTINYLLSQEAKIIIISHLGRPEGRRVVELSLKPVAKKLTEFLKKEVLLVSKIQAFKGSKLIMLENLRFWPEEETNDQDFAKKLASLVDFYVNDAFAVSHRKHASMVGIPQFLPSGRRAFGLDFLEEIEALARVRKNPKRPVVVILGGIKRSKIEAAKKLVAWADYILVGGKLIEYDGIPAMVDHHQKILGDLTKNGEDITIKTVEKFKEAIAKAKTIVWSGPMGAFEDKRFERGTREIAQAVVASQAYTVVGGGDTEAALTRFGLVDKIDYISSGGGAMLVFLAEGTLPGIEAIRKLE